MSKFRSFIFMCNFLLSNLNSFVKFVKFLSDSNKEMHMHVLNKFIHVHLYFSIGIKRLVKQNPKEKVEIKRREISGGMRLNKALLMMYRHCFKSLNTGDIREIDPRQPL